MLEALLEDTKKTFGDSLSAVLQYGSSIIEGKAAEDLDIIIVLANSDDHVADLSSLESLLARNKSLKLDMQLLYAEEVFSAEYFSIDNHGNFFLEVIKRAKVLYGENPVAGLQLDTSLKRSTLFNQIQHYVFRARQEFIGLGRYSKDQNRDFHRKKIKHILGHILMLKDDYIPSDEKLLEVFVETYPGRLGEDQVALIKGNSPIEINIAMGIYEALYALTLELTRTLKDKLKTKRINLEGMIVEYSLAASEGRKTVVLLDGLPSVPDQKYIMKELIKREYDVFFPRYLGTWESEGDFLSHNPAEDIEKLIGKLSLGVNIDDTEYKSNEIYVLATSFGGSVALTLPDLDKVCSIITLSPVIDYTKLDIKGLGEFLKKSFPGAYRFEQSNWDLLSSGHLIEPLLYSMNSDKHFILGGENDPEVSSQMLREFADSKKVPLKIYSDQSHMSFSALKNDLLTDVLNIMRARCPKI